MRISLTVLAAFLVAGCATRNTPCETLDGIGRANQNQQPTQTNDNLDFDAINQIGDTGAGQVAAPTKSAVELQVNNSATSPQIADLFGVNSKSKAILETVTPGEAAVARAMANTEKRLAAVEDELTVGVGGPERIAVLKDMQATLKQELEAYIARLDAYAASKLERAERAEGMPLDLSSLETLNIVVNSNHHVGTDKQMTDGEATAISNAVQAALLRQIPGVNTPTEEGGGS